MKSEEKTMNSNIHNGILSVESQFNNYVTAVFVPLNTVKSISLKVQDISEQLQISINADEEHTFLTNDLTDYAQLTSTIARYKRTRIIIVFCSVFLTLATVFVLAGYDFSNTEVVELGPVPTETIEQKDETKPAKPAKSPPASVNPSRKPAGLGLKDSPGRPY